MFCLPNACVVVNGRSPGLQPQPEGWTFEHKRGDGVSHSCVEFCICDARLYPSIRTFEIISHGGLPDHNLLPLSLNPPTPGPPAPPSAPTRPTPARIK
jgi:hypothetical protein